MAFEPAGMADKLGNRYEGRWVARKLLSLLNEEIQSVTIELIGPDEYGVDLLVVKKDGTRQLQQCKARFGSRESWTIAALSSKGILDHLKNHLDRDLKQEFALISAIPGQSIADICDSARNSNDNPSDFFRYQIQEIGGKRPDIFRNFCNALQFDPKKKEDLQKAFDYLKRTYVELFSDNHNTWKDLLTWAGFLLTGEPETAISVLLTYVENDKYRKPVYADELRQYLANDHKIYPKQLEHDQRLLPAVDELKEQFAESIRPGLIGGAIIPRAETPKIVEAIDNRQDVIVHGAAGYGKSGVLYALTDYFQQQNIPYLPVRFDRRIPDKNAKQFGKDLGLPESPAYSLAGLVADRNGVLILDQLDAIRWTSVHSRIAMDVCNELLRQVRSLRRSGKNIVIVFACRTFDLENDQEIKKLAADSEKQCIIKIPVSEFSNEQLKEVIGSDFNALTDSQKRILSCPQNLAIYMELKKGDSIPAFRSATELMRRFWENRRQIIEQKARISSDQVTAFLKLLVDYMEDKGEISAPAVIAAQDPCIRDALISFGILQASPARISFCHQRYLDYLIAERLMQEIYKGTGSVIDWLGAKKNQSLFRREQLRQVISLLADDSPQDFFRTSREILESAGVRFHLKHLVLELIGQLDKITNKIGDYFLKLFNSEYWRDHIQETVFLGHAPWVSYLLNIGVIVKWLESDDEQEVTGVLWLLRSVAKDMPDQVTDILIPFLDRGDNWPSQILGAICWNMADDSESMFELRLKLARKGHIKDFVDWKKLCAKHPLRAIRLIEAVLSTWDNEDNDDDITTRKKSRIEQWYDQDSKALNSVVKKYPIQTWDLFIPHIHRLTNFQVEYYDPRLKRWKEDRLFRNERDIARGVVELVILAGITLAASQPEELISRTTSLEKSISLVIQEIIISSYAHLPASYSDKGIAWLLDDPARFRLRHRYHEPEWIPAVRLITALSPHCSEELFQHLEKKIIHYHASEEKRDAEYYLKGWRDGSFDHYWGKTQYFLLPALNDKRIQKSTAALIRVLNRKFKNYDKKRFLRFGGSSGGMVGSKLSLNLEKISDKAWLRIVTNKKVTERDNHKWIQVDPHHVLATSIRQFAGSLSHIAIRFPERFGRLALQFPDNVHTMYISAILDSFKVKQPPKEVPESEKASWQPARIETIEAVLDKYQTGDDRETAISFCRLIKKRADENWSDKTIARLVNYACNHPDLEIGKLNLHCDKNSDEATVEILFENTINCVRGVAAGAIGQLLWERNDRLDQVRAGIESLVRDPHPAVQMAAIEAIEPVLNIDRNWAVHWFCEACKNDLRVAASHRALQFFNYTFPNYIDQVGPIIQHMVVSPSDDVAQEGARQVTARYLFHGFFEKEFAQCIVGTLPQRKGVADVASSLLNETKCCEKCQELLRQFMNDPVKDVRDKVRGIFRKNDLLEKKKYCEFIKEYIQSRAFVDDPTELTWCLKDFTGSLIPLAEVIFVACEELSTTLQEKTQDMRSRHPFAASEFFSILLRLYEQAQGENGLQIANQCLDIWDLFFENRVGMTIELTRSIEQ